MRLEKNETLDYQSREAGVPDPSDNVVAVLDQPYDQSTADSPYAWGQWFGWASLLIVTVGTAISLIIRVLVFPVQIVSLGLAIVAEIQTRGRSIGGWITMAINLAFAALIAWMIISGK